MTDDSNRYVANDSRAPQTIEPREIAGTIAFVLNSCSNNQQLAARKRATDAIERAATQVGVHGSKIF